MHEVVERGRYGCVGGAFVVQDGVAPGGTVDGFEGGLNGCDCCGASAHLREGYPSAVEADCRCALGEGGGWDGCGEGGEEGAGDC